MMIKYVIISHYPPPPASIGSLLSLKLEQRAKLGETPAVLFVRYQYNTYQFSE